jgi:hypothetical protein
MPSPARRSVPEIEIDVSIDRTFLSAIIRVVSDVRRIGTAACIEARRSGL